MGIPSGSDGGTSKTTVRNRRDPNVDVVRSEVETAVDHERDPQRDRSAPASITCSPGDMRSQWSRIGLIVIDVTGTKVYSSIKLHNTQSTSLPLVRYYSNETRIIYLFFTR